jgi:hypothetical protein
MKPIITMSVAGLSLFAIGTSVRAETIKYKCADGDTIRVDTKAQTLIVTDVSEGGGDFNQPNVQISNEFISYGTDRPIRINRKTGAAETFDSGRWVRVDSCRVVQ